MPPTLQGRVRMSTAHLVVVAVVVSGGLALTGWWVTRAAVPTPPCRRRPRASSPSVLVTPDGAPSGPVPASGATVPAGAAGSAGAATPVVTPTDSASSIVVDVAGKVRRPGIAEAAPRVAGGRRAGGGRRGRSGGSGWGPSTSPGCSWTASRSSSGCARPREWPPRRRRRRSRRRPQAAPRRRW